MSHHSEMLGGTALAFLELMVISKWTSHLGVSRQKIPGRLAPRRALHIFEEVTNVKLISHLITIYDCLPFQVLNDSLPKWEDITIPINTDHRGPVLMLKTRVWLLAVGRG